MQPSRSDLLARIACVSPRDADREGCVKGTFFFTPWREESLMSVPPYWAFQLALILSASFMIGFWQGSLFAGVAGYWILLFLDQTADRFDR